MPEAVVWLSSTVEALPVMLKPARVTFLPASGQIEDAAAGDLARGRLAAARPSRICVPHWRGPFHEGVDHRLLEDGMLVAVVDARCLRPRQPLVLDLVSHYLAPMTRTRMLTAPDRVRRVAALNRRVSLAATVIRSGEGCWLETADPIAGELVALTMRELEAGQQPGQLTPWEDDLVQRATELELGARMPAEIRLCQLTDQACRHAERLIAALHLRTGVDISML